MKEDLSPEEQRREKRGKLFENVIWGFILLTFILPLGALVPVLIYEVIRYLLTTPLS